jgi:predicted membrane GTPase involved in stress response
MVESRTSKEEFIKPVPVVAVKNSVLKPIKPRAGKAVSLTPAIKLDLEQALEFIDDDELVEVTPNNTRIRKRLLTETERKRARLPIVN